MGDWSDKLDYEYREYYGHFYDPDREEETEEMTTVEILKEMAFTATETQRRALEDAISALSENKGEWHDDGFCGDYVCSVCNQEFDSDIVNMKGFDFDLPKFCPNCGARMKGGE